MIRLTSLVSPQVLGKPVNSKTSVVKENEEPEQNVANGLPQTQGDDKITMTRESLKNIVREVMKEEGEYQKIFHKLLNKFGVNSPADLSDEQKKKFFSLAKGVQTELKERMKIKEAELTGNQSKLDMDKDGDIEADDLAKLRASKNESNDGDRSIGTPTKQETDLKGDIEKLKSNMQVMTKNGEYFKKAQRVMAGYQKELVAATKRRQETDKKRAANKK
jgi:hypothetical protein